MRNIQIADRSAWVTTQADATKRPERVQGHGFSGGSRTVKAMVFALAIALVPTLAPNGIDTVDAAGACFRLVDARFDARGSDRDNLNGEWVLVKNTCGQSASLRGWRVRDVAGNTYRFPTAARLASKATVKVHTGRGTRRAGHLYWGRSRPVWNNRASERAYLINRAGNRVSTWPRPAPRLADPTVAPTPTPAPTSAPAGTGAWAAAFLSRPVSGAIRKSGGCDNLVIENRSFKDLGADVEAIHLERCNNVTIRANDFARVAQAITVLDSTNVRIEWNRYQDILGPHARVGKHRANFVQLVRVKGGVIADNKGKDGDTEDIVSMYESGGTAGSPFVIERNQFEGTNWTSTSGSGIALGDGTSSYSIVRDNTLLNVGQVGAFIAGGTNHKILDNVIFGEQRPSSNVGLYVWNQSSTPCSGHEVSRNRVSWRRADGGSNPSWNAGNCGAVAGWSTNQWNAALDPSLLRVGL
ncbi:MAG: lamin tail domain-containing protein [Candidatus Limnocylindrales bacterium]